MASRSHSLIEANKVTDTNHNRVPVPGSLAQNAFLVVHDLGVSMGEKIDAYLRGSNPGTRRDDRVRLMEAAGIVGSDEIWVTLPGRNGSKSRRVRLCDVSIEKAKKFLGITGEGMVDDSQ